MSKREMIEGALRQRAMDIAFKEPRKYDNELVSVHWMDVGVHEGINAVIDALAEQAIVIECEVGHKQQITLIRASQPDRWFLVKEGHHGTPGKAIAIIVSLGEER